MESKFPRESGISVSELLDPSSPLVLWVVLPAAVLAAVGLRKGAIMWVFGAVVLSVGRQLL